MMRRHTREIDDYGACPRGPAVRHALTIVSLSSIGLPGTTDFLGEFLVLSARSSRIHATMICDHGRDFRRGLPHCGRSTGHFNPLDKPANKTSLI